jgi:competence protein ComEA
MDGILVLGLGLIAVGIGMSMNQKGDSSKVELVKAKVAPTVVQVYSDIVFDIAGEVVKPGVYKMPKGGRIEEALMLAGGLAQSADRGWVELNINRAQVVSDGAKIFIPKKSEKSDVTTVSIPAEVLGVVEDGIVDINKANREKLEVLSGVGPAMAQKIIEYREKNGGFKDINEIKMVSGIGDKMYEKIKEKIKI